MNTKVIEAIKKSAAVPSVPQVVTRFLEIMQDPSFDYDDLVKVLSADAGTVSEILRLVNSALFGIRHKIVSLRQALTLLGPMRTRSLLVGRYLVDTMGHKKVKGLDMGYFWRRSLASSVIAARFAEKTLPHQREEVFIAALLADIGVPILAEAMPDKYHAIAARYAPSGVPFTAEEELDAVEATHAQVSAMVLAHWSLPDTVTTAVNLHQSCHPGEGSAASVARILRSSDVIARLLCQALKDDAVARECAEAVAFMGASMEVLVDMLPVVESDIEGLADVLRIDVIPGDAYAFLSAAIQEGANVPAASG